MGGEIFALLNRRVYTAKPNCCVPLQQRVENLYYSLFVLIKKFVYLHAF